MVSTRSRPATAILAVLCTLAMTQTSCTSDSSGTPTLTVEPASALADQPVRLRVSGLDSGQRAVVEASATDYQDVTWRAEATFKAGGDGTVDLDKAVPSDGTYDRADGMGLFWSMEPDGGEPDETFFYPRFPELAPAFDVRVTVTVDGREVASQTLRREWKSEGVTHRALRAESGGIHGDLYLPAPGGEARTPVLLLGGSEGGSSQKFTAALLASRGHPALSLAYFGAPGLPSKLSRIPLEYFRSAAELLTRQPGVRPGPVAVIGYSRGTEAALLLAHHYPDLFRGTVLYAPGDTAGPSFPEPHDSAWTRDGQAVPREPIPVANVAGPVLAVAGGSDNLWPAVDQAQAIEKRLSAEATQATVEVATYPDAGHHVGTYPFQPAGVMSRHPVSGETLHFGGNRAANAAARADSRPKVVALLAGLG